MIDKRVNVAKRLKDYKDILETYEKYANNKVYYYTDLESYYYYKGKAAAYSIALSLFKEYLEKIVIKKRKGE